MKNKALIFIFITLLFLSQTSISAHQEGFFTDYKTDDFTISEDVFTIPDWKEDYVNERKELRVYNESETFEGYTLFNCDWNNRANASSLIVDMDGNIVAAFDNFRGGPELINSTTILFQNNTHFVFWNMETNTTEYVEAPLISILSLHHDYEYNPFTDQFLILGREKNGTVDIGGTDHTIVHDTITLIDRNNNTLWHWRGYEHIPFNQEYFYLTNHTGRGSTADWTHANTIFWDMEEENIVYLNARHTHTIYKIDMITGDIIWALGEYDGDFTLFNKS
ncbi:MAG: aryl-sulfate sulfotransferase, partial [Candidatus Heimdallarchaeota archaeon]|nr:aryl-sulfate sulfotransferase [Candidatus Heimdallarchaeota archaeon]MCK4254865.1 aryl-sulfate sulfotransferase [Candidatus Heimdallarchaeota archaeon]